MVSISVLQHLDCGLPLEIGTKLDAKKNELQMLPDAAAEALELVKDPNCTIAKFASVVERDVKLAADILALANSVMYSPGRPIASLQEAVVYVGFKKCQNIILSSCAASMMQKLGDEQRSVRDALWQHSLTTAVVAAQLNKCLSLGFQGEEFTAGLLHDFGRLLLSALVPAKFSEFDRVSFDEAHSPTELEREHISTDHAAVGCAFVVNNRLPEELAEAVRYHHEPRRGKVAAKLVAATALSDEIANYVHRDSNEPFDLQERRGFAELVKQGVHVGGSMLASEWDEFLRVVRESVDAMSGSAVG
ncbi:MAG: HDOD domain-containing protein [Pirellulaceae bacterium]|nr:HDOD domain-containing protein [Planctomycetales bacterium]